jgi:hypothetical protein
MSIKTKFIRCSCGSEAIVLDKYGDENYIDLSIWENGCNADNRLSWYQRFRWCWKIIKSGRPFGDQITLDFKSVEDMVGSLIELSGEKDEK